MYLKTAGEIVLIGLIVLFMVISYLEVRRPNNKINRIKWMLVVAILVGTGVSTLNIGVTLLVAAGLRLLWVLTPGGTVR